MAVDDLLNELERRRRQALEMGGEEKLARRRAAGVLNARERIDRLFDPGTFIESGLLATSLVEADRERKVILELVQLPHFAPTAGFADRVMAQVKVPTASGDWTA